MIRIPDGQTRPYALHFEFWVSNNEVEYEALLAGLRLVELLRAQRIEVSSNLNFVVQQMNGVYEAQKGHITKYLAMAKELMARFRSVKVEYVPWAMNMEADLLSRVASFSFPISSREIRIQSLPQKNIEESVEQMCVNAEPSWVDPLLLQLKEGKLTEDDSEAREIKRMA